jgi:hypothetical protein
MEILYFITAFCVNIIIDRIYTKLWPFCSTHTLVRGPFNRHSGSYLTHVHYVVFGSLSRKLTGGENSVSNFSAIL